MILCSGLAAIIYRLFFVEPDPGNMTKNSSKLTENCSNQRCSNSLSHFALSTSIARTNRTSDFRMPVDSMVKMKWSLRFRSCKCSLHLSSPDSLRTCIIIFLYISSCKHGSNTATVHSNVPTSFEVPAVMHSSPQGSTFSSCFSCCRALPATALRCWPLPSTLIRPGHNPASLSAFSPTTGSNSTTSGCKRYLHPNATLSTSIHLDALLHTVLTVASSSKESEAAVTWGISRSRAMAQKGINKKGHTRQWPQETTWRVFLRCPWCSEPPARSPAQAASWPAGCPRAPGAAPLAPAGCPGWTQTCSWSPEASRCHAEAMSAAPMSLQPTKPPLLVTHTHCVLSKPQNMRFLDETWHTLLLPARIS